MECNVLSLKINIPCTLVAQGGRNDQQEENMGFTSTYSRAQQIFLSIFNWDFQLGACKAKIRDELQFYRVSVDFNHSFKNWNVDSYPFTIGVQYNLWHKDFLNSNKY